MNNRLVNDKSYNVVTLIQPDNQQKTIQVRENEYINDAATNYGISLPSSCNAGVCVTCTAKLVKGNVIHDHDFLQPNEEDAGFILTCRTLVTSDCTVITHQEEALLNL